MFAIASPLMMIGNAVSDRRQTARENREARTTYEHELAAAQERISRALASETERRRNLHADPAAALLTAVCRASASGNAAAATPMPSASGWAPPTCRRRSR